MKENQIIEIIKGIVPKHDTILIGIDGLGGAGKSTLAEKIKKHFKDAFIIQIDDFYKPLNQRDKIKEITVSEDFDWDRMEKEVFQAVTQNEQIKYKKCTWDSSVIGDEIILQKSSLIIVEGIYSTQERFRKYYDYTIWVETSRDQRIKNTTNRVGEELAQEWQNRWMKKEDRYYEKERPDLKVDYIIAI